MEEMQVTALYILMSIVHVMLQTLWALMIARALLSFIVVMSDSEKAERIYEVVYALTEPVIVPVRAIFDRLGIGADLPVDLPFFVTCLLISLITMFI